MRIVLVEPPSPKGDAYTRGTVLRWGGKSRVKALTPPLLAAYVAAVLERGGFDVRIVDANVLRMSKRTAIREIERLSPRMIVIDTSLSTLDNDAFFAKDLSHNGTSLALMGYEGSQHPEVLKRFPYVDYMIRGEPEYTALELAQAIRSNAGVESVRGIAFRSPEGNIVISPRRPLIDDLDRLPFPARHLLPQDRYRASVTMVDATPFTTMISSRGCTFACTFCTSPVFFERRWRARSPVNVVDEIEYVVDEFGTKGIYFRDDEFTLNHRRAIEICNEMLKRKIDVHWTCASRADLLTRSLAQKLRASGCTIFHIGVESGNQEILNAVNKKLALDKARYAFKLCKEVGIKTVGFFIIGLPRESWRTVRKTIEFAKQVDADFAQFTIATPYPGTEFYNYVLENDLLVTEDLSRFDPSSEAVVKTPFMSPDDLIEAQKVAYKMFYLRWRYIIKILARNVSPVRIARLMRDAFGLLSTL